MKSLEIRCSSIILVFSFLFNLLIACSGDSWEPFKPQSQTQKGDQQKKREILRRQRVSEATITGPDYRMCPSPCCGGWNIMIDSTYYTFSNFPENSGIDPTQEKFPLNVQVIWSLDTLIHCNHINVLWMKVDNSSFPVPALISEAKMEPIVKPPSIGHRTNTIL